MKDPSRSGKLVLNCSCKAGNGAWSLKSSVRSPQWQIEAMRRLEIPEDMQRKYGFPALGGVNSPTKQMIFGTNAARLYGLKLKAAENTPMPAYSADRLTKLKGEYELAAKEPSNLRYGYVRAA